MKTTKTEYSTPLYVLESTDQQCAAGPDYSASAAASSDLVVASIPTGHSVLIDEAEEICFIRSSN